MPENKNDQFIYLGVCACFLLSGFAALLYQTAWMRQFSTVFGTSELAIATVLSAYMGGLALGAALAGKYISRVKRPVLTYGILEASIAGSALMVPVLLGLASWAYAEILGGQPEPADASGIGQSIFYFVVAFIVLAIPTACMGATLPLLTSYAVTADSQVGSRVGTLYAINTVGAVLGTVVAAFVLLPAMGLKGTVWFGAAVNLLVFFLAVAIAKRASEIDTEATSELTTQVNAEALEENKVGDGDVSEISQQTAGSTGLGTRFILPIMLVSGTTSFVYEVLWTRLLSHILGGSVTAFATMLASFLAGIAIGSALASRIATTSGCTWLFRPNKDLVAMLASPLQFYCLQPYLSVPHFLWRCESIQIMQPELPDHQQKYIHGIPWVRFLAPHLPDFFLFLPLNTKVPSKLSC
jgi:spermidine synthase